VKRRRVRVNEIGGGPASVLDHSKSMTPSSSRPTLRHRCDSCHVCEDYGKAATGQRVMDDVDDMDVVDVHRVHAVHGVHDVHWLIQQLLRCFFLQRQYVRDCHSSSSPRKRQAA